MKKIEHQYFGQLNLAITDDVFEVKFGSGRLTENQKSTQAYRRGRNAHANTSKSGGGAIKTSVY